MQENHGTLVGKSNLATRFLVSATALIAIVLLTIFFFSASLTPRPSRAVNTGIADNSLLTLATSDKPSLVTGTLTLTDICSQHPNICPVDQHTWPGVPSAWQHTGKKWHRLSSTPGDIEIMWFWSSPYLGTNPAYESYREVHYDDYSNSSDTYPVISGTTNNGVTGTPPIVYEWQTWIAAGDDYRLNQYGGDSEETSHLIGEYDCDSSIYYPMTDHTLDFAYTPMSVLRGSPPECVGGGYMAAHQVEQWGKPLSLERIAKCDNPTIGVPASESPVGNAVCKVSPYVGIVYQRYAWGGSPTSSPHLGCEGVVYTWGWPKPQQINSGQDYQIWFRNGELRFSKWVNLSYQVPSPGQMPAPDDHAWWNTGCEREAWTGTTNWVYSGLYRIGLDVYTDTLSTIVATSIPISGGSLSVEFDGTTYDFAANTFTDTVIITHAFLSPDDVAPTVNLSGINHFYQVMAVHSDTGSPARVAPGQYYTVSIHYADTDVGMVLEDTLALYHWDNNEWSAQGITSTVNTTHNILSARVSHLSLFGALGETRRVYLPLVRR